MDLSAALRWVDAAMTTHMGHSLREPEIIILKGTWRGLTYEQMANDSEYSTNYLMRDVAPKLWKHLSNVFNRSVGKTNFRVALEAYASANAAIDPAQLATIAMDLETFPAEGTPSSLKAMSKRQEADHGWMSEGSDVSEADVGEAGARISTNVSTANVSIANVSTANVSIGASLLSVASILPGVMYGYEEPLRQVNRWLYEATGEATGTEGQSRLIGIWGLRGVGKTLLVETAVAQMGGQFEGVIWRSLHDHPTLNEFSLSILTSLGIAPTTQQATSQLLSIMASRPLLLVLEGVESLLQPASLAGDYPVEHQGYIEFFQSVISSRSCVVLTGIEGPEDLVRKGGYSGDRSVRSLTLTGLSQSAAIALLDAEQLSAAEYWPELIERYQGHPLALKSAARVIKEIFNGRVDDFLHQSSVLFNGIFRLLSPSFDRLSSLEINVLYWLASYESPLSLATLRQTLPLSLAPAELISALDSLKQRSLLSVAVETEPPTFYLPALVKAYTVHQFMGQFSSSAQQYGLPQSRLSRSPLPLDDVIDLSPVAARPVQLNQWFQGQFDAGWHSIDWLFESSPKPALRLRSAYHLRDETFLKRCKSVEFLKLGEPDIRAILLVAVHRDTDNFYKVCVQVQPAKGESVLPQRLGLKLLDASQSVLAMVTAEHEDTFIQLPYFRGSMAETFAIELSVADATHRETFVI